MTAPLKNGSPLSRKRSPLRGFLISAALLAALLGLAYAFRTSLLKGAAEYLIVNTRPLEPADLIFLLNGDYNTRPFQAGELYLRGLAPRIAVARIRSTPAEEMGLVQNETDISVQIMEKLGVPSDKILLLPFGDGVSSTFDEAVALHTYVRASGVQRVIIVTSAFHTRRTRWIVEKELAGSGVEIEMSPVPYGTFDVSNWWKSEDGLIALNNEYVKLFYYYWKYR